MQVLFPPATSGIQKLVRVAFAGHRVQACRNDVSWRLGGTHPLTDGTLLPPSNYEFGYELVGATYTMDSIEIECASTPLNSQPKRLAAATYWAMKPLVMRLSV